MLQAQLQLLQGAAAPGCRSAGDPGGVLPLQRLLKRGLQRAGLVPPRHLLQQGLHLGPRLRQARELLGGGRGERGRELRRGRGVARVGHSPQQLVADALDGLELRDEGAPA
jgi:hypothetical protein